MGSLTVLELDFNFVQLNNVKADRVLKESGLLCDFMKQQKRRTEQLKCGWRMDRLL